MLEVKNVFKSFKKVKAVQGVDFTVNRGEYIALLGPNGAGKTTLVEMIEGIQPPDSGEILINNKTWKNNEKEIHNIIGISFQETRFFDKLTVKETVKLFASFYDLPDSRTQEVINLVNLQDKEKAFTKNLSGGQRQRLALAIALLNHPKILLLDEPTTGLDPTARREIWNILNKLKSQNNTSMILTTHYMEEAEQLCDRIIIMNNGKIIAQGTLNELLSNQKSNEIIEFSIQPDLKSFDFKSENIVETVLNEKANKITIYVSNIIAVLPKLIEYADLNNLIISNLICRKLTLDDLFVSLTGKSLND